MAHSKDSIPAKLSTSSENDSAAYEKVLATSRAFAESYDLFKMAHRNESVSERSKALKKFLETYINKMEVVAENYQGYLNKSPVPKKTKVANLPEFLEIIRSWEATKCGREHLENHIAKRILKNPGYKIMFEVMREKAIIKENRDLIPEEKRIFQNRMRHGIQMRESLLKKYIYISKIFTRLPSLLST